MSFHIFTEHSITPTSKIVDIRGQLGADPPHYPHRIGFFVQTTVADLTAGVVTARLRYEDETHNEHNYELTPITLTTIDPAGGGFRAQDVFDAFDKYFESSVDPGVLGNPEGLLQFELDLGGPAGTALITYACMLEKIDGSSTVYTHP